MTKTKTIANFKKSNKKIFPTRMLPIRFQNMPLGVEHLTEDEKKLARSSPSQKNAPTYPRAGAAI